VEARSPLDMNAVKACYQGLNGWERRSHSPPFLQSGVPRPQTAFFSRGNARFQAGKLVSWECNFSSELINLKLVKITA